MKIKTVICFIVLFYGLFISLYAQVRYIKNIPIQLPQTYFYEPKYTPKQIYPCPDGGVIILGDCLVHWGDPNYPNVAADCGAIKLDAAGNCEWQWWSRNFSGWGTPQIVGIDQGPDGRVNFIIKRGINMPDTYDQIGWITPQNIHFMQIIDIPDVWLAKALRLPNGDIFATGGIGINSLTNSFYVHLNAQGDTLATRHYPPDSLFINYRMAAGFDMELDTDGMPVTACMFSDRYASVVKTDWDGNIIWRRDTNLQVGHYPFAVTKIPDTNELVLGYLVEIGSVYNQYVVYRINTIGLDSLFYFNSYNSSRSIIGHNQGIYTAGSTDFEQIGVANYSISGQNIWSWTNFGSDRSYQTDRVAIMPDSSIVYVYCGDDWGSILFVVKLLPDGTESEDETILKPDIQLCTYPNPMKSFININLSAVSIIKDMHIPVHIYNVKGQLVRKLALSKDSTKKFISTWDGKNESGDVCSNGAYLIRLNLDGKTTTKKIMLIK